MGNLPKLWFAVESLGIPGLTATQGSVSPVGIIRGVDRVVAFSVMQFDMEMGDLDADGVKLAIILRQRRNVGERVVVVARRDGFPQRGI